MALKDWKKILDDGENIMWKNKVRKASILIYKYPKDWLISVSDSIWNDDKYFKPTKSQALKFAKSYMRTH